MVVVFGSLGEYFSSHHDGRTSGVNSKIQLNRTCIDCSRPIFGLLFILYLLESYICLNLLGGKYYAN